MLLETQVAMESMVLQLLGWDDTPEVHEVLG